jgi:uncharacterized protein (DUF302 family)
MLCLLHVSLGAGQPRNSRSRNMTVSKAIIISAALAFLIPAARADIVKQESALPVKETMDKLEAVVAEKGFKVFARIDHAAGAKSMNQELRPTELLIFGNPAGGTPLIQAEQAMGLTLPLKVLAWQDEAGKVWIGYDDMGGLLAARGLPQDHPAAAKIGGALKAMTGAAAK